MNFKGQNTSPLKCFLLLMSDRNLQRNILLVHCSTTTCSAMTMMTSQMKLTTCQWHSLHRALVCRLYHTNQQSDGRSNLTHACQMSHLHNTNSKPIVLLTRHYSQYRRDCTCITRVRSMSRPLWRVPERCASRKTSEGKTMNNIFSLKSSRYVLTPEMASLMIDKIWHGESIPSDRLIIEVNPGKLVY